MGILFSVQLRVFLTEVMTHYVCLLYAVKVCTTNSPIFRENCNFTLHWKRMIKEGLRGLGKH